MSNLLSNLQFVNLVRINFVDLLLIIYVFNFISYEIFISDYPYLLINLSE